ncbi:MAG: hypothetical protein Q8P42_11850 [Gallionella sp.]|nr:hypothetical protein [Gallionella sp.]
MTTLDFAPPAPITADQELTNFDSGELSLNEWLKKRAFKNHASGASRCFVLCAERSTTDVSGQSQHFLIFWRVINLPCAR